MDGQIDGGVEELTHHRIETSVMNNKVSVRTFCFYKYNIISWSWVIIQSVITPYIIIISDNTSSQMSSEADTGDTVLQCGSFWICKLRQKQTWDKN